MWLCVDQNDVFHNICSFFRFQITLLRLLKILNPQVTHYEIHSWSSLLGCMPHMDMNDFQNVQSVILNIFNDLTRMTGNLKDRAYVRKTTN